MKKIRDYSKIPKEYKRLQTTRIKDSLGRVRGKITYAKKAKEYKGEQLPTKKSKGKSGTEVEGIFVKSVKGQKPRYYLEKALFATEKEFMRKKMRDNYI
jgi:hypothetical protein